MSLAWVEPNQLEKHTVCTSHTLGEPGPSTKTPSPSGAWIQEPGPSGRELKLADRGHGEVSDPHHHPGERPPAHDQPLLPGREGPGAEPRASHAGQGPGRPAAVPRPDGAAGVGRQQPAPRRPAAVC